MLTPRHYTLLDRLCLGVDQAIRAVLDTTQTSGQPYPAETIPESTLTDPERRHAAALMRVNHSGEVCAQALYHGQAMFSRTASTLAKMEQAALEEGDHLAWCKRRLDELNSHTSYLNPCWYAGSFLIGAVAGVAGDDWSLGFVAETEQQVIRHLNKHLHALPQQDERSHQVLRQMEMDETKHRDEAVAAGARILPRWIQSIMTLTSKVMVKTAYYI